VGESILADLEGILLDYRPNKIFVSHPADTNVDHRALYLFLQIALLDLRQNLPEPKVYPYLVHCVGWPRPRRYHPDLNLEPPKRFLGSEVNWQAYALSKQQLDTKYKAVLCYKSQTESSAFYLLSFVRENELFSDYPRVELEKQASLKEKAVSFFGFSSMYPDLDIGALQEIENLIEDKGKVSYAVVDNSLLVRIEKGKRFGRKMNFLLYLFGYSPKTPFAKMPKIRIITAQDKIKVFDAKKMITPQGLALQSSPGVLILKVPLEVLGEPDFILSSIKASRGILPVDATGFRKIYIKK